MIRTALWLLSEVGIGNVFTKEQHRLAFPGVAQADRRLRDLRGFGWVIHTNLEDVSLNSNEQRFVTAGSPVWDPVARKQLDSANLSAKQRRIIFADAGYQCTACGIAAGENYQDSPWMSATLSISKRTLKKANGDSEMLHIVECKRCQSGNSNLCEDIEDLRSEIHKLSTADQQVIAYLINQAADSPLLKVWSKFRFLSPAGMSELTQMGLINKL